MSEIGVMLFITVLPVILILVYVNSKDKNKEPTSLLLLFFLLGILASFATVGISTLLEKYIPFMNAELRENNFINTFLYAFIGVAFIEEFSKWIMLYLKGYKNKNFDEYYDIIVYAVFISLGFALLENIIYVLMANGEGLSVAMIRAVSAIPGHACDGIFMGYYLALAKSNNINNDKKLEKNNIILSILVPVLLHGIYDFCLMSEQMILIILISLFIIFLYYISIKKIKEVSKIRKKIIDTKIKICPNCGTKVETDFCPNCGRKIK